MKRVGMHGAGMISPSVMGGIAPLGGEYYLDFNGTSSFVNCGSDASLDNLPAGATGFTLDMWMRQDRTLTPETFVDKRNGVAGFVFYITAGNNVQLILYYGGANAMVGYVWAFDSLWHHWAITYDETADRIVRMWLDGVHVASSAASAGAYLPDAPSNLMIARNVGAGGWFDGGFAWMRLSDIRRWTANFTPPPQCTAPAVDANTVELWTLNDGSGVTATASVNSPANDGAITNGTWYNC